MNEDWSVAKVADFGTKADELGSTLDDEEKLPYLAPELHETPTMTKAANAYAFGVLMWEVYAGSLPSTCITHHTECHTHTHRRGSPSLFRSQ